MEFVDGDPLSALLKSGPLQVEQALDIVASGQRKGLLAAFDRGVIHRTYRHRTFWLRPKAQSRSETSGIARSPSGTLTTTGMFIGKPSYAAPEAFAGHTDARSDIYSLGIVLFEMLSGRPPFLAPTPLATMKLQESQPPPRLTDLGIRVSPAIQQIVDKCLQERIRGSAFQTPRELLQALTRALHGQPVDDLTRIIPAGEGDRGPPAPSTVGKGEQAAGPLFFAIGGVSVAITDIVIGVALTAGGGDGSEDAACR